jgi:PAS domain S-box-containing protein
MAPSDLDLGDLWSRLAEPSPLIVDPAERRTARLLSRLLLVITPLGSFSVVAQLANDATLDLFQVALALAIIALLFTYVLSRTRYSRLAALITTLIPTVAGLGVLAADASDPGWFAFMALNPALGSLLLPTRSATVTAGLGLAAVFGASLLEPGLDADTAVVAIMFNVIVTAVLLIARRHRSQLERDRRAELVARQRLNQSVLAASFGGIAMIRDGVIDESNEAFAELLAMSQADLVGTPVHELFAPDSQAAFGIVLSRSDGHPAEVVARRRNGSTFDAEILALRPDDDEDAPIVMAIRDISERKRATEAFVRAQRMESVGRLAAGIAHDTNNQLSVVGATVELLLQDPDQSEEGRTRLRMVRSAADHIAALVQRVLVASRRRVSDPVVVELESFVAELEPMWRSVLGDKVDLELGSRDGSGCVLIDPIEFEQVLLNLVLNARDAMHGSGVLRIDVGVAGRGIDGTRQLPMGEYAAIAVTDSGEGIASEHLDRVFEAFFTTKGEESGTGLGLYTCRDVVERAGGALAVESRPGATTFQVLLPWVDANPGSEGAQPGPSQGTVLIVDDSEPVRSALATLLRSRGYGVWETASAAEAIVQLERRGSEIDCVLTDLNMPGMGGDELVKIVQDRWPGITPVLMSGYASQVEPGSTDYLTLDKPFSVDELSRLLQPDTEQ